MYYEETEFDLLEKLATQTGLSLPESQEERNSILVQKRILRHTIKCLKESSRSPACTTALDTAKQELQKAEDIINERGVLVGIDVWKSGRWYTLLQNLVDEIENGSR